MERKSMKFSFTQMLILAGLFLFGCQVTANEYYTVNLDSVSFNDTLIYCSGSDSIKLISPTGSTDVWWMINDRQDTIYSQILILPDGSNGDIICQYLSGSLSFSIYPFVVDAGEDMTGTCGSSLQLDVNTNLKSSDILSYQWSSDNDISSTTIPNTNVTPTGDAKCYITVTARSGCQATDSVNVILSPKNAPDICMVGFDDSNKNIIIWEKPAQNNIDSVFIFKETLVTDQYKKIGAVDFEEGNSFIDTLSNPDIQSNKYRISLKDICGLESEESSVHKTLHLSINQGQNNIWNLIWESYEGFPVSTYYIYRGTSKTNLELIGTSPASNTQYSDLSASEGSVYYQIEVVSPNDCSVLKSSSYSVSRSNIVSFETSTSLNQSLNESQNSEIYPNPCEDELTILSKDCINSTAKIINLRGSTVMHTELNSIETKLDISDITPGIYFIQIITVKDTVIKRLIKK